MEAVLPTFDSDPTRPAEAAAAEVKAADRILPVNLERHYFKIVFISAVLLSIVSAWLFISSNDHNHHFDSKGHQLVPRRVFDNLTPGWKQLGAFWLPLPHLLYMPLVKSDWWYFNGYAGIPFSMISFVLTVLIIFKLIEKVGGPFAGFCGSLFYLTNPNMLYLQSTSLTENLSLLFLVATTYFFVRFIETKDRKQLLWASLISSCGVLTRYENWFAFSVMGLLLFILAIKEKRGVKPFIADSLILLVFNLSAMALSFWINHYTTGKYYLEHAYKHTDFQPALGSFFLSAIVMLYTLANLISYDWTIFALIGMILMFRKKWRDPIFIATLVVTGPMILYLIEYWDGHPTRIRYGLPFVPAAALFVSYWVMEKRLYKYLFIVFGVYILMFSPFHRIHYSKMLTESMRDGENLAIQGDLLWYLRQNDDNQLILVAMSEIAPQIYNLKLPLKRYVHEGVKPHWNIARETPEKIVGWVFLSQDDHLWNRLHDNPEFHKHFELIGRRGALELYRKSPDQEKNIRSHRAHGHFQRYQMPPLPGVSNSFNKTRI